MRWRAGRGPERPADRPLSDRARWFASPLDECHPHGLAAAPPWACRLWVASVRCAGRPTRVTPNPPRLFWSILAGTRTHRYDSGLPRAGMREKKKSPQHRRVLYTHAHADHVLGLDDLRRSAFGVRTRFLSTASGRNTPKIIHTNLFRYAFDGVYKHGNLPQVQLKPLEGPLELFGGDLSRFPMLPPATRRSGGFALVRQLSHRLSGSRRVRWRD